MQRSLFLLILFFSLAVFLLKDIVFSYSPDSQSRIISIKTELKGSYQEGIEELITIPLEEELFLLDGIKSIRSVSEDEQSIITIRFEDRTDLGNAYLGVREVVDRVSAVFPEQAQKPAILKNKNDAAPVFLFMLNNRSLYDEKTLKEIFQGVPGTGQVDVSGAPLQDVILNSSPEQLNGYGYSSDSLAGDLASNNRIISLNYRNGFPLSGDLRFEDMHDLRNRLLRPGLRLKDLALPYWQNAPLSSISTVNGSEAVLVRIRKAGDANTIKLCRELRAEASALSSVQILYDKGQVIENALKSTGKSIGIGVLCVFLITGFFLGSWKNAFVLCGNIPFSVVCTLALLNQTGRDIDMMVLSGTAVGIGLVIDGAVIVLESGYQKSRRAVFFSMISTIIVFLSLIYAPLSIQEQYLGMVYPVIAILLFSIIYIFLIMPGLLQRREKGLRLSRLSSNMIKIQGLLFKFRYYSLMIIVLLSLFNFFLAYQMPGIQSLSLKDNSLGFSVEYPSGTSREAVRRDLKGMEEALNNTENIDFFSSEYKSERGSFFIQRTKGNHQDAHLRSFILEQAERLGGSVFFSEEANTVPYDIVLCAYDRKTLYGAAENLVKRLGVLPISEAVVMHYKKQQDILSLNYESDRISGYKLTPASVFRQISSLLNRPVRLKWIPPNEILDGQSSFDIRISGKKDTKYSRQELANTVLYTENGASAAVFQLMDISEKENFGKIYHNNGVRSVSLSLTLPNESSGKSLTDLTAFLNQYDLQEGVRIIHGENMAERRKTTGALIFCTILSLFLVLLFLIFVFESFRIPVFLFLQLPGALLFPIPFLVLLDIPLSAPVFFGMILVTGVSVNNGIVLFNGTAKEKLDLSIISLMYKRHSVSLITAFATTLASVFPLLFSSESGGSFLRGLSVTICFGLLGSLLTLLLVTPLLVHKD